MSLKRRPKIEHSSSPKVSAQKQNDEEMLIGSQLQANKQNSTEYFLLKKMQQKIGKILKAYQKLDDESKKKDQVIKELEKQNSLLKERLVEKTTEINQRNFETRPHPRKDSIQEHVIQRTFTPKDIKIQPKPSNQQFFYKPTDPTLSIVREFEGANQLNRLLKQSRSLENLNKTTLPFQPKYETSNFSNFRGQVERNEDINKIFSKRDENRLHRESLDEDQSFIDVLGKLKQKIKRFDEEDAQNIKKMSEQKEKLSSENINQGLSKVKSSHSIANRSFNLLDKTQEVQTKTLKNIWSQRDEQIKRMDELFSKIDQRINVIEKQ